MSVAPQDACRSYSVRGSMLTADGEDPHITYITPGWLWYYIYTVGLGMFGMGYTLHGGHALSSSVMALSLMMCTVPLSIYEAASMGRPIDLVARVVGALLLVPATILLAVRPCRVGGYGTQSLWLVRAPYITY